MGELSLRRLTPRGNGSWADSYLPITHSDIASSNLPTAVHDSPLQRPVVGSPWAAEDHARCRVAQLYGGYILPGSTLDAVGGVGLVVSEWHTERGWPYRVMQFRATLRYMTKTSPVDVE